MRKKYDHPQPYGSSGHWKAFEALDIERVTDPSEEGLLAAVAELSVRPEATAATVLQAYQPKDDFKVISAEQAALIANLKKTCEAIHRGDMAKPEAMLISQAQALDAIFVKFSTWALMNWENMGHMEQMLRLGLKAQSQSRATLQALVEVKYPRQVQFIRQQNIGQNVQVNNVEREALGVRVREGFKKVQTKLLEAVDGQWLDFGAAGAAIPTDSRLETMATIDRTEDTRGQAKGRAKRLQGRAA